MKVGKVQKTIMWKTVWIMCKTVDYQWFANRFHRVIHRRRPVVFAGKNPDKSVNGTNGGMVAPYYFSFPGKN